MGRKLSAHGAIIRQYYDITKISSTCTICGKVSPGYHSGNLARHLERKHPQVVAEEELLLENAKSIKFEIEDEDNLTQYIVQDDAESTCQEVVPAPAKKRSRLEKPQTPKAAKSSELYRSSAQQSCTLMSSDALMRHYLNIIVCDGLPVTFMSGMASSSLFQVINQHAGMSGTVEPQHLERMILSQAADERQIIVERLQETKGFSLILEEVSNACAVLAQVSKEGVIERHLLGVLKPYRDQEEKVKAVLGLCASFSIDKKSIYSILNPTITGRPDAPFNIPCLAELFLGTIKGILSQWKIFDKIPICLTASTEELMSAMEQCLSSSAVLGFSSEEAKTLKEIIECFKKAQGVYENITNPETCKVITDIVAAVYKFWIQTNRQSNAAVPKSFALGLKQNFCNELMNYEPIRAAMFLDPRIQQLLSSEDKAAAKVHLKNLHLQLGGEGATIADEVIELEMEEEKVDSDGEEDDDDDLTMFLKEKTKSGQSTVETSSIERLLNDFTSVPLLSAKTDLLSYWETSTLDEQLKRLARVVHSVPAVQRNFIDENYFKQVRANDGVHSVDLQEAIFFVGGNLRLNYPERRDK